MGGVVQVQVTVVGSVRGGRDRVGWSTDLAEVGRWARMMTDGRRPCFGLCVVSIRRASVAGKDVEIFDARIGCRKVGVAEVKRVHE